MTEPADGVLRADSIEMPLAEVLEQVSVNRLP